MNLPPLPKLPKPRNHDQAVCAGVHGAPNVIIDDLPFVPVVVTRVPMPNSNIVAAERIGSWPPARDVADLVEIYRIGRALRGIALLLDRWGHPSTAIVQTGQALLDRGAFHLRMDQPYGLAVLLNDYAKVLQAIPVHGRGNQSVTDIIDEIAAFAAKHREWDTYDY